MPKQAPYGRWKQYLLGRYAEFKSSRDFKRLRRRGLRVLGRTRLLPPPSFADKSASELLGSEAGRAFLEECRVIGERYGLAQWVVKQSCLHSRYRLPSDVFPIGEQWESVRIVTRVGDEPYLSWLLHEAWQLGLHVMLQSGSSGTVLFAVPFPEKPGEPLSRSSRPPRDGAFTVRVETPPMYPPEAAAELHRSVQQAARQLLRRLGYKAPDRLRTPSWIAQASKLRLGKDRLGRRETGEIAEGMYGKEAGGDPKKRKRVRDLRYKAKQRRQAR